MPQRPQQREAESIGPHVEPTHGERGHKAVLAPQRFDVAHFFQVFADLAAADIFLIGGQLVTGAARLDRVIGRFGGSFTRQHRVVVALDARHVDHAHRTAQQRHTGCDHLGHRLVAAFGDGARAVGHALAAFQQLGNHRVVLEALEFHVGEDMRVLVAKVDNETDVHLVVFDVIDERPATRVAVQRPAHRVGHGALFVLGGVDLPDLFHAKAVFLRLFSGVQIVFRNHLLGQAAAHAFGQEDVFTVQFHTGLIAVALGAIGADAEFTGHNAFDLAIVAIDKL